MDEKHNYVKEEVIAWRDRWRTVEEIQLEEWRKLTPQDRYRELLSLIAFAKKHGLESGQDPSQPRSRWAFLKKDTPIA
jgi:hypothetical protein